ncbi:MAG: hypothetical protein IPG47_03475 [Thermoflexaceae bacterium]|nr:hypothetical protein [Thermoflexaceae bacterium]
MSSARVMATGGAALAALALCLTALAQSASGWDLSVFAYGGGGTSSQSPYSVQGIIGQPVTGAAATGGTYTVQSGFFAGFLEKFKIRAVMLAKDGS